MCFQETETKNVCAKKKQTKDDQKVKAKKPFLTRVNNKHIIKLEPLVVKYATRISIQTFFSLILSFACLNVES